MTIAAVPAVLDIHVRGGEPARVLEGNRRAPASRSRIQDMRGTGAIVAIELFKNGDRAKPDADLTKRLCVEAVRHGLIQLLCDSCANVISILLPLTASDAVIEEGLAFIDASIAELTRVAFVDQS